MAEKKEVWQNIEYKTPEELADALERSSNINLAQRVREVWENIKWTSTDWRTALRDELTWEEEQWVKDTLWNWVEVIFNDSVESQNSNQVAEQVSSMIPKEQSEKVEQIITKVEGLWKFENWWKSIVKWWEQAMESFQKGNIVDWIKALFAWFMGKLFSNDSNSTSWWENSKESNWENTRKWTEFENIKRQWEYIAWVKFLLWISNEKTSVWYDILMQKNVREKSYNSLWIDSLTESWLASRLWVPGKDKDVYETLLTIKSKEQYIQKLIWNTLPNWKDIPLEKLIWEFHVYLKPFASLEWISWDNLKEWNLGNFMTLDFEKWEWTLHALLENRLSDKWSPFHWVDKSFLSTIYFNDWREINKKYLTWIPWADEKFVEWFINFRNKLPGLISNKFYHWKNESKAEFASFFNRSDAFSYKDVLELYLVTNGNIDSIKYNDFQEWLIFMKVFSMLWKGDKDGLLWRTYWYALKEWVLKWNKEILDKIPPTFKEIALKWIENLWLKAIKEVWWFIANVWWALDNNERVWFSVSALALIAWFIYLRTPILIAKALLIWYWVWQWINFFWKLYDQLSSSPKVSKLFKEKWIDSPDKLEKSLLNNWN